MPSRLNHQCHLFVSRIMDLDRFSWHFVEAIRFANNEWDRFRANTFSLLASWQKYTCNWRLSPSVGPKRMKQKSSRLPMQMAMSNIAITDWRWWRPDQVMKMLLTNEGSLTISASPASDKNFDVHSLVCYFVLFKKKKKIKAGFFPYYLSIYCFVDCSEKTTTHIQT